MFLCGNWVRKVGQKTAIYFFSWRKTFIIFFCFSVELFYFKFLNFFFTHKKNPTTIIWKYNKKKLFTCKQKGREKIVLQGKKIRKKVSWEFFFFNVDSRFGKTVRETKLMFSFIGEMNDLIFCFQGEKKSVRSKLFFHRFIQEKIRLTFFLQGKKILICFSDKVFLTST